MGAIQISNGGSEERAKTTRLVGSKDRAAIIAFSALLNVLMFTGPIFMLQVYDRVLPSRSNETLAVLFAMVVLLYALYGVLDYFRRLVLYGVASKLEGRLSTHVLNCQIDVVDKAAGHEVEAPKMADLKALTDYYRSPVAAATYDAPWIIIFIVALFVLHPILGIAGLSAVAISGIIGYCSYRAVARRRDDATGVSSKVQSLQRFVEERPGLIRTRGIRHYIIRLWRRLRADELRIGLRPQRLQLGMQSASKTGKLFIQSGMLMVGAALVLSRSIDPSAMIVASILAGRAIGPIETIMSQLSSIQQFRTGRAVLLKNEEAANLKERRKSIMPRPDSSVICKIDRGMAPNGKEILLRDVKFSLPSGAALGVIGPVNGGKSALLNYVAKIWPIALGSMKIGGIPIDQFAEDDFSKYVGVVTDELHLFPGTIAENIAGGAEKFDMDDVLHAAWEAGVHDRILLLPDGYQTDIEAAVRQLSRGSLQLLMLAGALFNWPVLLVLDEPFAHLDGEGRSAVRNALETHVSDGGVAIISSHLPDAVRDCTHILQMKNGRQVRFGPRAEILGPDRDVVDHRRVEASGGTVGRDQGQAAELAR